MKQGNIGIVQITSGSSPDSEGFTAHEVGIESAIELATKTLQEGEQASANGIPTGNESLTLENLVLVGAGEAEKTTAPVQERGSHKEAMTGADVHGSDAVKDDIVVGAITAEEGSEVTKTLEFPCGRWTSSNKASGSMNEGGNIDEIYDEKPHCEPAEQQSMILSSTPLKAVGGSPRLLDSVTGEPDSAAYSVETPINADSGSEQEGDAGGIVSTATVAAEGGNHLAVPEKQTGNAENTNACSEGTVEDRGEDQNLTVAVQKGLELSLGSTIGLSPRHHLHISEVKGTLERRVSTMFDGSSIIARRQLGWCFDSL